MTTIRQKFELNEVQVVTPPHVKEHSYKIDSNCAVGIEVEVENANHTRIRHNTVWQTHGDGSLRNGGVEFITYPIEAQYAPAVLQELMTDILAKDCCFSPRTSVHVHMNAQDLTVAQVVDYVMLYAVYEKLFYNFAGRGRINNIYCVPITHTQLLNQLAERGVGAAAWSKYTGLNLAPLGNRRDGETGYGTIEYRQMHGTFNVEKLCVWIDLITRLKTYVQKSTTKDIRELITSMDTGFDYQKLLGAIFGNVSDMLKYTGPDEIYQGVLAAKSAMLSNKVTQRIAASATGDASFFKVKD